jgi:hypothetical protein
MRLRERGSIALVSKADVISQVRELTRELGSLCADHNLVRLETLLWATEQQAVLETLLDAADLPDAEELRDIAPGRAA